MYYVATVKCPRCEHKQNTFVGNGSFFPTVSINCDNCSMLYDQSSELYHIPYNSLFNKSNNHLAI